MVQAPSPAPRGPWRAPSWPASRPGSQPVPPASSPLRRLSGFSACPAHARQTPARPRRRASQRGTAGSAGRPKGGRRRRGGGRPPAEPACLRLQGGGGEAGEAPPSAGPDRQRAPCAPAPAGPSPARPTFEGIGGGDRLVGPAEPEQSAGGTGRRDAGNPCLKSRWRLGGGGAARKRGRVPPQRELTAGPWLGFFSCGGEAWWGSSGGAAEGLH